LITVILVPVEQDPPDERRFHLTMSPSGTFSWNWWKSSSCDPGEVGSFLHYNYRTGRPSVVHVYLQDESATSLLALAEGIKRLKTAPVSLHAIFSPKPSAIVYIHLRSLALLKEYGDVGVDLPGPELVAGQRLTDAVRLGKPLGKQAAVAETMPRK